MHNQQLDYRKHHQKDIKSTTQVKRSNYARTTHKQMNKSYLISGLKTMQQSMYFSLQAFVFYATLADWIRIIPYINSKALLSATSATGTKDECLIRTHLCFHFHYHECIVHTKASKKKQ